MTKNAVYYFYYKNVRLKEYENSVSHKNNTITLKERGETRKG